MTTITTTRKATHAARTTTAARGARRPFGAGFYSPLPSHVDIGVIFDSFVRYRLLDDYCRFSLRDYSHRPRPAGDASYNPYQVWGLRVSKVDGSTEWRLVACFDHPGDARGFKGLVERFYPRG